MVKGDSAIEAAALLSDESRFVLQAWDSRRALGESFARTLRLKCPAWDVYLIYEPGIKWIDGNPPEPSFWMHQLGDYADANPDLHLSPAKLEEELKRRLKIENPGNAEKANSNSHAAALISRDL